MRNMSPYDLHPPLDLYNDTVERKRDSTAKTELQEIQKYIEESYANYDRHFLQNDLEFLPKTKFGTEHKAVLLGLYSPKTKLVKTFRERFFKINPQTYNNLCPYCAINSANTTDHILPKNSYPAYAVNVKNLIPGCSECNVAKGENLLSSDGKKIIINYYTDIIPDEQFLFVDISRNYTSLKFEYRLANYNNQIDPKLFSLIERHFERLHLLTRYKDKAIQQFAEIRNLFVAEQFDNEEEYDIYTAKLLKICDSDAREYGRNHWKIVLKRACAKSIVFKKFILSYLGTHNVQKSFSDK